MKKAMAASEIPDKDIEQLKRTTMPDTLAYQLLDSEDPFLMQLGEAMIRLTKKSKETLVESIDVGDGFCKNTYELDPARSHGQKSMDEKFGLQKRVVKIEKC